MEELSLDVVFFASEAILPTLTIGLISEDGIPDSVHMDSYLMGTPRLDMTFEQGIFSLDMFPEGLIVSHRRLSRR